MLAVNGVHFTYWVAWAGRWFLDLSSSLSNSRDINENWLWIPRSRTSALPLSWPLHHCESKCTHRVGKTRDTRHLAVCLWEVSLPMDSQVLCLYKRKTGVYFCFINTVTKKKPVKDYLEIHSVNRCALWTLGLQGYPKTKGKSKVHGWHLHVLTPLEPVRV